MLSLITKAKEAIRYIHSGEAAQDAFEYLLIIGGVSVAVVILMAAGAPSLATTVIAWVTTQINTI